MIPPPHLKEGGSKMRNTYRVNYQETDGSYNSKLVEADRASDAVAYVEEQPQVESIYSVELIKE